MVKKTGQIPPYGNILNETGAAALEQTAANAAAKVNIKHSYVCMRTAPHTADLCRSVDAAPIVHLLKCCISARDMLLRSDVDARARWMD